MGNLNSKQGKESLGHFTELNQDSVTIIQVSQKNATYGKWIFNLLDEEIAKQVN